MVAWAHLCMFYIFIDLFFVCQVSKEKNQYFFLLKLLFCCFYVTYTCVCLYVCLRVYSVGKISRRQWGKVSVLLLFVENGLLTPSETKSVSVCAILRV